MTNVSSHDEGEPDGPSYEVGYKKPPKSGQFTLGHKRSKGRRKGSKNIRTIIDDVFYERVSFMLKGKKKTAAAIEVILRQLQGKALGGNDKAIMNSVAIVLANEPPLEEEPAPELTEAEQKVLTSIVAMKSMLNPDLSDGAT